MKNTIKRIAFYTIIGILAVSCSDNNNLIGSSIDYSDIQISTKTFRYSENSDSVYSKLNDVAVNRAIYHMLGKIDIKDFASVNSSYLTNLRYIGKIDTVLVEEDMVDSLVLILKCFVNQTIGDDLMPMRVTAYQNNTLLPKNSTDTIFTDVNPEKYCDLSKKLGEKIFSSSPLGSSNQSSDTVTVRIPLSRNGMTTQGWAKDFYNYYRDNKGYLTNEDMQEYLPGLYITHTYGDGFISRIDSTIINLYHKSYVYNVYGEVAEVEGVKKEVNQVTPILVSSEEVSSVNCMETQWKTKITDMAEQGKPVMTTPLGYNAHIILPVNDIIDTYNKSIEGSGVVGIINSVTLSVPVVKYPENEYDITPPPYLMMIRADANATGTDNLIEHTTPNIFFFNRMLPDNTNTYYASYNSSTKTYDFGNIQAFISNILKNDPNNGTADKYKGDSHVILVPVGLSYDSSSSSVVSIYPYLESPRFAQIDTKNINVTMIYSVKYK